MLEDFATFMSTPNTTFTVPAEYAHFGRRVIAKLVDMAMLIGAMSVFIIVWPETILLAFRDVLFFCLMSFPLAYNAAFLDKFGATPGKMLAGLKVVTASGEPLGATRAFGRAGAEWFWIVCLMPQSMSGGLAEQRVIERGSIWEAAAGILFGLALLWPILMMMGNMVRLYYSQTPTLLDQICGTRVVRK